MILSNLLISFLICFSGIQPSDSVDLIFDIYNNLDIRKPPSDVFNKAYTGYAAIIINELSKAERYGLLPQDYHVPLLQNLLRKKAGDDPKFDVLLSDGLLLFSHHLINGKLDPAEFAFRWNFPQRKFYKDSIRSFLRSIRKELVIEDLAEHHPPFLIYDLLVNERVKWVEIRNTNDILEPLIFSRIIRPGDSAQVFPKLLERMKKFGFSPDDLPIRNRYDSIYIPYIKTVQRLHGHNPDGVIGKQTFASINITPERRIQMIDTNLERIRWLSAGSEDDRVFVNIAGFHLYVVRDKEVIWDTPVMTGKVSTQTPVFTSSMTYMVFNPTWTVPRSILRDGLFSRMKADQSYVINNKYHLVDQNGRKVDPSTLEWKSMTLTDFPFSVVQQPGPGNALGLVKFMFPNKYSVYLHDTPSKSLFSQSSRAFSYGCIRVKDPLILARILLNDENRYSEKKILDIIKSGSTKTVFLDEPISVLLTYFTVDTNIDKEVVFREDIYHRDGPVIEKLKMPLYRGKSDLTFLR